MFGGMTLCIPWDIVNKAWSASRAKRNAMSKRISTNTILSNGTPVVEEETKLGRLFMLVFFPALCDVTSTFLMYVGMMWIAASIWQMLRGSIVVFTAIIRMTMLKKRTYNVCVMPVIS